jgi:putative hydrolase of the HAD superfamily
MKKKHQHIVFDLDHTLWDFDANCKLALTELYEKYHLERLGIFELEQLIVKYKEVNDRLWDLHHRGLETKETIRNKRFYYSFLELGATQKMIPEGLDTEFIHLCPTKGQLIDGALDLLEYLRPKYKIHILTNGFKESQYIKMECAGISDFFSEIILAEECGFAKPDKKIFDYTLQSTGGDADNSIMIGDDLMVDVVGAKNAGWDHVFLNRKMNKHSEEIMYEITQLKELKEIL